MSAPESAEREYEKLSPFELKNELIEMAGSKRERIMLNAGRGNPNWVATVPREAFFELGRFAVSESQRTPVAPGLGGIADPEGIAKRFDSHLEGAGGGEAVAFLRAGCDYAERELGMDRNGLVAELVDAILGDHYPGPDRILNCTDRIVHRYLVQEMCADSPPAGRFDLFATEGGTAAMAYIFNSLMENKLLHKGDKIAIGTPIFTPYLEIPRLSDYEFVELEVEQAEGEQWQYPDSEIDKLADPAVKAFFLVNPANPTSVAMHSDSLSKIAKLVEERRKDLIILTDDVYGTFVNGFRSLAAIAPHNTILVYSFSKYFGATGWRLGVIAIHEDNVLDERIAAMPKRDRDELVHRYSEVDFEPAKMKLIERMVADSRAVALHHTAGLSTPQQVQMVLFSLFCLVDRDGEYKKTTQGVVVRRIRSLYEALGAELQEDAYSANYYTTIDVPKLARERFGDAFARWLVDEHEPIDFVWRLADEKSIVLMDGGGFDAPDMSVRVSLANLADDAYVRIGKGISDLLAEYHERWKKQSAR